jgi:hypothetical protein
VPNATAHRWQFTRSGGFDQVRLASAADYAALGGLDRKLWAALACPVKGLELDERTLALVDTDGDGRIRAPEVVAAVRWTGERLADLGSLREGAAALPLSRIRGDTEEGRALGASARRILEALGKKGAEAIAPEDAADTGRIFGSAGLNGDGVVAPSAAGTDAALARLIGEIRALVGGVPDRGGGTGIDRAKADAFFAALAAWRDWHDAGEAPAIRPLGDRTAAAAAAVATARAKVDDWFARGRAAAFDPRALEALNRDASSFAALAAGDLSAGAGEFAAFPLARVEPGRPLPLAGPGLNPAWAPVLAALRRDAVAPLLGGDRDSLDAEGWAAVTAKLGPFLVWEAGKPAPDASALGIDRVREILASDGRARLEALLAADAALDGEFRAVADVERLARYHRDLDRLLHNFVNFADFYSPVRHAIFQAGVLYLDGRACELCVRVEDPAKHAALAGMAKAYLAYCDCTRPSGERLTIAAAFTGGDSDYLMVGRNGLFVDRKGRDWDATITRVVENPISIRQAFWYPYKKLVRMIEEMVAKRAAAAESASDARVAGAATAAAHADAAPKAEAKKIDVGTVAALGVAVGALGTLLTTLVGYLTGLFHLPFWQLCLAAAGLLLLVSTPSMLIAWLKLRQRNLGPILDANGWAVNGRVRMNVPFGASLTSVAALPEGAVLGGEDPYGDRPSPWPRLLAILLALCFLGSVLEHFGVIHDLTGGALGESRESKRARIAAPPPPAEPRPK